MTLHLLPNTAALLSHFLREQPEVADMVDDRVYTILPKTKTYPVVRVSRIGGTSATHVHWLDAPLFQVDVWADTSAVAFDVAEMCRAVISQRFVGVHRYGDISGVVTSAAVGGLIEGFDPDEATKARDRFDVVVHAHPARQPASS